MGFDWQAFATGFLQQTAKTLSERSEDAREYEDRQRQLAERNMATISKRRAVANQVVGLANMLRDNGASPAVIQAAISAGPKAVADLASKVEETSQKFGRKLSANDIDALVRIPEGFEPINMDTADFIKKTYGLGYEGAGVAKDKPEMTFMDRLTGRKKRDMARYRLDSEVMTDGLTAYDINEMAAQSDYESLVPGTFISFNEIKRFDPATDMASFSRTWSTLVRDVEDSDEFKTIQAQIESVKQNLKFNEVDAEEAATQIRSLQQRKQALYRRNTGPTIEALTSTYGDTFLDATEGFLTSYLGEDYVNSLRGDMPEDTTEDAFEPAATEDRVSSLMDQQEGSGEAPSTPAPEAEAPSADAPEGPMMEQEVRMVEPDDMSIALLNSDGAAIMQYLRDKGVSSEEEMVAALNEWGQENNKVMPFDKGALIYALKPYVLEQ